ncbi:hypothetical protein JCM8115_002467 [Rhodotorula mucilaginosa]
MARRASGSKVSYKELDSDGDEGMAPWGLSDGDDVDADLKALKALKAAAPLAKKRKKAGAKSAGDTYGARRPQRKKAKRNKAPLPVKPKEDCESDAVQKDPDDGNPVNRAVDDGSDESDSEQKAASNEPNAAATESTAAGKLTAPGFSGELLLQLPFEISAPTSSCATSASMDRSAKESAQIVKNNRSIQLREAQQQARVAMEKKRQLTIRVEQTVKQLRDSHGWTSEDTAKLQQGMTANYVQYPYSLAPKRLPNDDRAAWTTFRVKYRAAIEKEEARERENEQYRQRQTRLEQTYASMMGSLEAELMFVPSWTVVSYQRPVVTFLRAKPTPGQDEAFHDPEVLRATLLAAAKQHVQDERVAAIRGIVAAHLGISTKQLSKKENDYPNDVYDEAFFQKIPNRFAVTSGRPRTFQQLEKQNNAHTWPLAIRGDLAEWRRATRHVLLAAGKEASSDLDEVDALGASFTWQNGPEAIKAHRYTWNVMVETIVNKGPEGLGLSDLKDISVVYTPNKGKGKEKALDTSDDDVEPVRRKKIVDDSEDDSSSDDSDA